MKKVLAVLAAFFVVLSASAQARVNADLLDLSDAIVTIAGPEEVYIRNIYYAGEQLSVTLRYDGRVGALVQGPYYRSGKLLQDYYDLGHVELTLQPNGTILVENVMLNENTAYSGTFAWEGGSQLAVASYWRSDVPTTQTEQRLVQTRRELTQTRQELMSARRDLEGTEVELAETEDRLETSLREVATLEGQVRTLRRQRALPEVELPTRTVKSGFSGGRTLTGSWSITSSRARQTDGEQLFAKYRIPVTQSSSELLYEFTARATGSGWIGYGMHFMASGAGQGDRYPYGDSYLVWLTRDRAYYGTDDTYMQLYRSYGDERMVQVASAAIPQSIASRHTVRVLYSRTTGEATMWVDEVQIATYPFDSPLRRGSEVVLRSLGAPVEFTGLTVKSR